MKTCYHDDFKKCNCAENAPNIIHLQIRQEEITWCQDQIEESDVKYIKLPNDGYIVSEENNKQLWWIVQRLSDSEYTSIQSLGIQLSKELEKFQPTQKVEK